MAAHRRQGGSQTGQRAGNNVDFQLHSVVLELERERQASLGFKKKVADLGDMNTKLSLTVSKQQQIIETHAKDVQKVEQKWRRKYDTIARELHLAQSALSQHLAVLRREKIVNARKEAQSVYYSLAGEEATKVMESLHDVFCGAGDTTA